MTIKDIKMNDPLIVVEVALTYGEMRVLQELLNSLQSESLCKRFDVDEAVLMSKIID